jgi:FG-GAP repeat
VKRLSVCLGIVALVIAGWVNWGGTAQGELAQTPIPVNTASDVTFFGTEDAEISLADSAGDLNGDGLDDVVLLSSRFDGPDGLRQESGAAFIYFGRPAFPTALDTATGADLAVFGAAQTDRFGRLGKVMDINGDAIDDLVVSSQAYGAQSRGRIDIIFGSRSLPTSIDLSAQRVDVRINGAEAEDDLGSAIGSGDVDGDGLTDLIVAARNADGPDERRYGAGEAYIFLGKSGLPPVINLSTYVPDVTIYGPDIGGYFAFDVATGDFNGDGVDDIVFGDPFGQGMHDDLDGAGEVQMLLGRSQWPRAIDLASAPADGSIYADSRQWFGRPLVIKDVVGDDAPDIVAGAVLADQATGFVYIFDGADVLGAHGLARNLAEHIISGDRIYFDFGGDFEIGDIDGDSHAELIASADRWPCDSGCEAPRRGLASIISLSPSLPRVVSLDVAPVEAAFSGADTDDALGGVGIGDFNGDGGLDLLLGSPYADGPGNSRPQSGEAYLILGTPVTATPTPSPVPATPVPTRPPGVGGAVLLSPAAVAAEASAPSEDSSWSAVTRAAVTGVLGATALAVAVWRVRGRRLR